MSNRLSILLLLLLVFSANISAAERGKPSKRTAEKCQLISRSDAISRAKARTGGKVVNVKLKKAGARSVYRVRVLVGEKRIKNITIKACR